MKSTFDIHPQRDQPTHAKKEMNYEYNMILDNKISLLQYKPIDNQLVACSLNYETLNEIILEHTISSMPFVRGIIITWISNVINL